ncbi:hypothetical protein WN48_06741 [Eufriesea mexicana]|uniref:Uncharacterized protein n=1 Tax=Eufriesea mexicana TaxID=516756 RepID=A0A310SG86_9HYME|nr:hypothetical protein WN48_06741 [Eufriesea mexicana]
MSSDSPRSVGRVLQDIEPEHSTGLTIERCVQYPGTVYTDCLQTMPVTLYIVSLYNTRTIIASKV